MLHLSICGALANTGVRRFSFDQNYQAGNLMMIPLGPMGLIYKRIQVGCAQGEVVVIVPSNQSVLLEINPHMLEHPERLAVMHTEGIDRLRFSYMSMDEERSICDAAMRAIAEFHQPVSLYCFRSDITDDGLSNFKSMNQVIEINCFASYAQGAFLSQTSRLQNLKFLTLAANPIKHQFLSHLAKLHALERLDLGATDLNDKGLSDLSKCQSLQSLSLYSNPKLSDAGLKSLAGLTRLTNLSLRDDYKISDDSIPLLARLTNLKTLDLRNTKITASGLARLKTLNLKAIELPKHFWQVEMNSLQKSLPGTKLTSAQPEVRSDIKVIFGPTVRKQ